MGINMILCRLVGDLADGHFPLCGSHMVPSCLKESAVPLLRPPTSAPQKQSQLLALKWRLHHMPASHLVYARGARLALISATMRKIGRCDCSLTCSACLHQTIKDAPCASVQGAWQRCLLNINASKQPIVCKVCSKVCSSFPGVRGTHNR